MLTQLFLFNCKNSNKVDTHYLTINIITEREGWGEGIGDRGSQNARFFFTFTENFMPCLGVHFALHNIKCKHK
jgi:hypothetical protein